MILTVRQCPWSVTFDVSLCHQEAFSQQCGNGILERSEECDCVSRLVGVSTGYSSFWMKIC